MAARYLVSGGDGNWGSTNNWSATSGGASGASVPTSADDVTFDSNSGATNITLNTSARSALTWTVTSGYTGTVTFSQTLTVSGTVSLGANMVFAGSSALIISASGITITSNGKTVGVPLSINPGNSGTITLGDNWTCSENVTYQSVNATGTLALNSNTIYCAKNFTTSAGSAVALGGTTQVVLNGTGTLQSVNTTQGPFRLPIEINTSGTITLGPLVLNQGTLKYTAGTVVSTGSTLTLTAASTITCNASGMNFGTISITGGNHTFNGTSGFTVGAWSQLVAGLTHTFLSGNTYSITSSVVSTATNASKTTWAASTASSAFYLNYSGSTAALAYLNATDCDASGGTALYTYQGTLTRTTNWTTGTVIGSGSGGGSVIVVDED